MWQKINGRLVREFKFKDFQEAFTFMTRVAFISEKMDHHPNWSNSYNFIRIELYTHSDGDTVTDKDMRLADAIDEVIG